MLKRISLVLTDEDSEAAGVFDAQLNSRMSFHPVYEVPVMRDWFQANRSPSEEVTMLPSQVLPCFVDRSLLPTSLANHSTRTPSVSLKFGQGLQSFLDRSH